MTRLQIRNRRAETLRLWVEPWCEEVAIPHNHRAVLRYRADEPDNDEPIFEWNDEILVFWSPAVHRPDICVERLDDPPT